LKDWSQYAKDNSYHPDKAQLRHDIGCDGCAGGYEQGIEDMPHQKREGRGYSHIDSVTARNTYTSNKGGTKRED